MDNPIHFMFGARVGFQGRRIEWHYFRLDQIQCEIWEKTMYKEWLQSKVFDV